MRAVAMVIGYERLRQRERGAACQPTTAWGPTSICRRILTVAVAVCPEPGRGGTNLDLCRLLRSSASGYSPLRCVSFCPGDPRPVKLWMPTHRVPADPRPVKRRPFLMSEGGPIGLLIEDVLAVFKTREQI